MSDKTNNENLEAMVELEDDESIVVMTDEDGNEYYYYEEMVLPIEGKNYAILVPMDIDEDEEGCSCGCSCGCEDDKTAVEDIDVFIARIDIDEAGEEVYVDPTDEEFEAVKKAYEEFMEEAE